MADMRSKIQQIYALEQLAAGSTPVHRLHPGAKLLATFVYIVTVVSFDRFQLRQLVPFLFYPAILMSLSDTPWSLILRRVALALPFVLLAGISNLIFDRATLLVLGGIPITAGLVSFLSVLLRTFLTVLALALLMAVTPLMELTLALRRIHVPELLITLFEMTYRYIGVLIGETSSMTTAYHLRHRTAKGLELRHMGSFVGNLLLRSFDRAGRIYAAMKCRGYGRPYRSPETRPWQTADVLFAAGTCAACLVCRFVDVGLLLGTVFGGTIA